ncbi:MAG TPA: HoxN/HupN/NixA family nickel/cobalt transporter [Trebonia sp.]|jgi:high-affinity nickel-transport protein
MALQAARSRLRRIAAVMTPREWARFGAMLAFILAINVVGWGIYVLYVMPHHFAYKGEGGSAGLGVGIGVAITAWFLGFRHAFDADHISCIDNTTRKLMADGKRPLGTGFFFSFGHSTVIVGVGVGITFAARAVFGAVVDPNSAYETAGGAIGTLLSAGFLYLIALLNLIVLAGIFKVFREMRQGTYNEVELEAQLQARGLMYRFFGRFMRSINHTWQLYFVGLIFGIGFDTTTEVLLLAATTYAAIQGLPYFAVLALPFLFSGGMMLFDTLDGAFMNFAYGWAFARPVRKVYYNLVITALSIGAAFIIGTIEILGILTTEFHLNGAFWSVMANFNINVAGFCIAGMFIAVWAVALIYWRAGNVEAKWTASVATIPAGEVPASRPEGTQGP